MYDKKEGYKILKTIYITNYSKQYNEKTDEIIEIYII